MKNIYFFILTAALAMAVIARSGAEPAMKTQAKPAKTITALKPSALAAEGKKNALPGGGWFIWRFDRKPRLGPAILKVQVYSKESKQDSSYEITGESGMPSMRDHDSGPLKFQLNRKGDYLLPINVVMAGGWEVVIRIKKNGKELFAGKTDFNV
ncbi:MAG: hypothetical protein WCW52_07525 [Elusimicrobiales bacterium]|jgi:hypothetical protein